ncbi:hypothetical protein AUP68_00027 [Ilyonectria robusta]
MLKMKTKTPPLHKLSVGTFNQLSQTDIAEQRRGPGKRCTSCVPQLIRLFRLFTYHTFEFHVILYPAQTGRALALGTGSRVHAGAGLLHTLSMRTLHSISMAYISL